MSVVCFARQPIRRAAAGDRFSRVFVTTLHGWWESGAFHTDVRGKRVGLGGRKKKLLGSNPFSEDFRFLGGMTKIVKQINKAS